MTTRLAQVAPVNVKNTFLLAKEVMCVFTPVRKGGTIIWQKS